MAFREATLQDIPQIQIVRYSVKENVLSDPGLVTDEDCESEESYMNLCSTGIFPKVKPGFGLAHLRIQGPFHFIIRPVG